MKNNEERRNRKQKKKTLMFQIQNAKSSTDMKSIIFLYLFLKIFNVAEFMMSLGTNN